jgi:hypothetical protein
MGKSKRNDPKAREKRERKLRERKERAERKQGNMALPRVPGRRPPLAIPPHEVSAYGNVPGIDRCHPPVHVSRECLPVPDPIAVLGLDPKRRHAPEEVAAAARAALLAHPPEREPEAARDILDARDRLVRQERVLERELGALYVPRPAAFDLPTDPPPRQAPQPKPVKLTGLEVPSEPEPAGVLAPSYPRLLASLALYALLAEELEGQA